MQIKEQIQQSKSKEKMQDIKGNLLCIACLSIIILMIISILYFICSKGIQIFTKNNLILWEFLGSTSWNPGMTENQSKIGALAMITTSFAVTLLSVILATPFAIAIGLYITEYGSQKIEKLFQPTIELLIGIPSVVYGYIGLKVVIPLIQKIFGGTGFGILAGAVVLFIMVLPTITSLTIDSLKAVPVNYRQASLALGATRWQTNYKIVLRVALPGILTAIIFAMTRAFGEALAVQMVIGNVVEMPKNLLTPTATLTSQLTSQMGNTIMGTLPNNALWTLALTLLIMSLIFNVAIKLIAKREMI